MRIPLGIVAAIAALFLLSSSVLAHGFVDQSSVFGSVFGTTTISVGGLWQTFTPAQSALTAVDIGLENVNSQQGGFNTITVNIRKGSIAEPVLASSSLTLLYSHRGLIHFDLPEPLAVMPGELYVLEVRATRLVHAVVSMGESYAGGGAGIGTSPPGTRDICFRTLSETPPDSQEPVAECGAIGTLRIQLDALPDGAISLRYIRNDGLPIDLDDIIPDDNDSVPQAREVKHAPGTYVWTQKPHPNFVLQDISCDDEDVDIDMSAQQITFTIVPNAFIRCTFTNLRKGMLRAVAYKDVDRDGAFDGGEPGLNQWSVAFFDAQGNAVPAVDNLTNQEGKETIANVPPGDYRICVTVKPDWYSTQPVMSQTAGGEQCYAVTVQPGKIVEVYFGNTKYPRPAVVQASTESGTIERDMPDEMVDDEAWLYAPLQGAELWMPLVID